MAKDPVCGMEVDERDASFYTRLSRDETLYFCSERCKKVFDQGPDAEEIEQLNKDEDIDNELEIIIG